MDKKVLAALNERNDRIISAILKKAEAVCPGSIALLGISGSFCTGDVYENSDLDPFIVINDDKGWKIASCFILGDTAHDLYCHYWGQLEEMAEYRNPYVVKLLNMKFVYCADEKYMERYMALRRKITERLASPLSEEDIESAAKHLSAARAALADVMIADSLAQCRYSASAVIYYSEFVVYMLNKSYIKRGVKRIPEEMALLDRLPADFMAKHRGVYRAEDEAAVKTAAVELFKCVNGFFTDMKRLVTPHEEITADALRGSYEEIFSNWRNKMFHAASTGDTYLSFMTASACTQFYGQMNEEFNIGSINAFEGFNPTDLSVSASAFDRAMEKYRTLYDKTGAEIKRYATIEEFESDYLDI